MADDPLTHFDVSGAAHVVSIDQKPETARQAVATSRIRMAKATFERIASGGVGKGDVLGVARIAAIGAAKGTAGLIPLCHPVRITAINVDFELEPQSNAVVARVDVHAQDRTGPEMEAMTAAATAALTIYDMCKAMDRGMTIDRVQLLEKAGGKSGRWTRASSDGDA